MSSEEVRLDRALFGDEVIARTAHRYTGDFYVDIEFDGNAALIRLSPKTDVVDLHRLQERFRNAALDEKLREHVRNETSDLQLLLINAALHESAPHSGKSES